MTNVESHHRRLPQIVNVLTDELIFDMDGTLIDSIAAVEAAWSTLVEEEGISFPPGAGLHGRTAADIVRPLVSAERFSAVMDRLEELETTLTAPVIALPGAADLLSRLPGERWSIVTSAARRVALTRLAAAGLRIPTLLVTGDDVARGKPDPEPYRAGKRYSGRAMAFEDTALGLQSAAEAGCITVGIIGTASTGELQPHADFLIDSLASVFAEPGGHDSLRVTLQLA